MEFSQLSEAMFSNSHMLLSHKIFGLHSLKDLSVAAFDGCLCVTKIHAGEEPSSAFLVASLR